MEGGSNDNSDNPGDNNTNRGGPSILFVLFRNAFYALTPEQRIVFKRQIFNAIRSISLIHYGNRTVTLSDEHVTALIRSFNPIISSMASSPGFDYVIGQLFDAPLSELNRVLRDRESATVNIVQVPDYIINIDKIRDNLDDIKYISDLF